jgi:hypothetical protein
MSIDLIHFASVDDLVLCLRLEAEENCQFSGHPVEEHQEKIAADVIDHLTAEVERRNNHCQDCPTFVEQDAIINQLSAKSDVNASLLDESLEWLDTVGTTEADKKLIAGFKMYCSEELQPFISVEITQSEDTP